MPQTDDTEESGVPRKRQSPTRHYANGTESRGPAAPGPSKKARAIVSCSECSRRKQKCDRKEPCSQCVTRNVSHLCRPVIDGMEDHNPLLKLEARMANMERMLNHMMESLRSPHSNTLSNNEGETHEALGSAPPGTGWGVTDLRRIHLAAEDDPDVSSMLDLMRDSGVQTRHLEHLVASIPGKRISDDLVELYFRDINWTRYPIHRPDFMKRYETLFRSLSQRPLSPHLDIHLVRWLPAFFAVLTIAVHEAPAEVVPSSDRPAWAGRLYNSARTSVDIARCLRMDNLDVLTGAMLLSRYTLMIRRPAEGGIPLSMAFPLGLYRDGSILHLTDKREIEIRRRAWAMLYHLDRSISLLISRPPIISDAHTDTQGPANLEDEELEGDFDPAGHPMSLPTVWTYFIVRHRLAEILGRIAYHTFAVKQPVYQTVLDLDSDLLADSTLKYLSLQRYLLACEWYYARVILHRPYLLRRGPHEGYFVYSQNAAVESAKSDLLNRRMYVLEKGPFVNSGGYRLLDSIMVLAVIMKLEPDTPRAIELKNIIDVVTARQPDASGRISEPLGQDEMATLEILNARPMREPAGELIEANVRDEHSRSLVDFVQSNPATSPQGLGMPSEATSGLASVTIPWQSAPSWPATTRTPGQTNLASWASMFEQEATDQSTAASLTQAADTSTSLIDELLRNYGMQQPFGEVGVPGNTVEQRFNPFALAQQGDASPNDGNATDEQTQLFNFLLSVIANQQPIGQ